MPEIPEIPEPENRILKSHLIQALNSLSCSPEPIKNFQIFFNEQQTNPSLSPSATAAQLPKPNENLQDLISKSFNPLIYGNDVDSIDVATRITLVQFLIHSKNVLLNFNEHTRTLRLYPRPVVAFQYNSFLRSRPVKSTFIIKLAKTQAVEYLAEWSLCPTNVAYLRIQTGVFDPSLIGDKAKWYCRYLTPIQFRVYNEKLSLLADTLLKLNVKPVKNDENNNKSDETPTDESGESGSSDFENDLNEDTSNENDLSVPMEQLKTMCVDVKSVYRPPNRLINSEDENDNASINSLSVQEKKPNLSVNHGGSSGGYESSFTTSSSSSSVGELFNNDSPCHQKMEPSKASSSTATPVNKTFPRLGAGDFDFFDDKRRTLSTNSHQAIANTIQNSQSLTRSASSVSSATKNKQLSLISHLSEELSDVANKAAKKVSELVNESSNNTPVNSKQSITTSKSEPVKNKKISLPRLTHFENSSSNSNLTNSASNLTPTQTPTPTLTKVQSYQQQTHFSSINDLNNENQIFLKEVLNNVLEGQGVGWLKYNRIKRLMEDENYRNFVLSRLNTSLDKKFSNDEEHIEDIKLTKSVFKGMAKLIQAIVFGLEQTYANNGIGGMASAYQLFEIIHTHYWIYDSNNKQSTNDSTSPSSTLSSMPSPFGSKENINSAAQSSYSLSKQQQTTMKQQESASTLHESSLVSQLGNLWNSSKLNSLTKTLSNQLTSNKSSSLQVKQPSSNIEINSRLQQHQQRQSQIPYYSNEATNPLFEEIASHSDHEFKVSTGLYFKHHIRVKSLVIHLQLQF